MTLRALQMLQTELRSPVLSSWRGAQLSNEFAEVGSALQ